MNMTMDRESRTSTRYQRIIGHYKGSQPGPTIVAVAGMHGNEASGVLGLEKLFATLKELRPSFLGELIGIAGNLKALDQNMRFIDQDLNRMWKLEPFTNALKPGKNCAEQYEYEEIQALVSKVIAQARGPVIFADLHTTSAESPPFLLTGDTLRNRHFVQEFPVPIIFGLEERLNGPLLSYINTLGHISFAFEAGQHDDPKAIDNHLAIMWLILAKAGNIQPEAIPEFSQYRSQFGAQTTGLRKIFEVRYRYEVKADEGFVMKPGYTNFQPIQKGEVLATNRFRDITAQEKGRVFMPLYQKQGDDGFFEVRPIKPFWLGVSRVLRKIRFQRVLPLLPGIRRHPAGKHVLVINLKVARWFGVEFFHLLGYRKLRKEGKKVIMEKRKYDLKQPPILNL